MIPIPFILFTLLACLGKSSAGRLNDFYYVILIIFDIYTFVGFTPRLLLVLFESLFRLLCGEMTDLTGEDAVRFARPQQIGIIKTEGESLGSREVSVGAENVVEDELRAANISLEEIAVSRLVMKYVLGVIQRLRVGQKLWRKRARFNMRV